MKVFIFLILFAFSSATILGQTWTQVPTGTDHTINDIFFVNKNIGWFVTHYGLVKKSTDGGLTWFKLDSLSYGAKRIQFLDMNNGYILSGNSYVYKTTNGGISWTPINTNFSVSLEGMDFISTQVGWVVGSSGKILKTTDGGQNWVNQSSITNEIFFDVDFLDANIGSVVGTGGKIYRSYLGGQDWFLQTSGTINTFSSVFLCNASYAWLTGYEIRKTSNGGSTWPTVAWISSFTTNSFFLNKDTGWVVTQDGQIGKTTNGQDFSGVSLIPSQNYNTVFFVDVNNGWVGGSFGVLLKYVIPQNIRLTSPDGGENWPAGSIRNITWDQTEIRNVKLEYSTNNGSDWIQIVASTPAYSCSYSWTIPNTVSSSCKVRVSDVNNSATNDESNSTFAITAAPDQNVTITSPTGGENWIAGNQYSITWSSFGFTNLKIEFSTNNGIDWSTITATVPASNEAYIWNVPYSLSASCKVRLTSTNNSSVTDQSTSNFIISPQLGQVLLHQDFYESTWIPSGWSTYTLGDTTFGQYWERSTVSAFDSGSGSAGYYFYQAHAGKLQALATYLFPTSSGTGIISFDHAYATKTNENDQLRIEYSTDDGTTWIGLRLLNGGISGELVTAPPTTVSFIPTSSQWARKSYSLPAGVNKVRFATISANGNNLYIDNIRISDSSTSKFVVITSPNGGESWTVGSTHNITWTQTGVTNVKLEYTTNSGTSWNQIVATTPGTTGSYFWTIPNTASTRCKIRITDVTDILISDQSDTTFTISELFQEVTIPNVPAVTHGALAWADYNNDGYLDFLVSGQGNQGNINKIFKNNGNGTFSEQSSFVLPRTASASIDWGDFNNDGYLDIIISGFNTDNSDWFTKVYMNDAGVQFIDATQNQLQKCHNGAVRWGDCDNDGDLDILVTGGGSAGEYFAKIYINDGIGGFHDLNLSGLTGVNSSSANWGDYDRDGDLDIIISGYSLDGIISKIYKNEGNNNFLFQSQISLSGVWQGTANWEDFNNDGFLDIIITGKITEGSAVTKIYKNNGDNSFSILNADPGVGLFLSSVQSGDFDNDGHTDLIQSGKDNSEVARTYFLYNNGDLTFSNRQVPMPGLYAGSVAGADFNNDSALDVLICGENGSVSLTKLFKNITPIANSAPVEPSNLNAAVGIGIVNFTWTPGTDDHTPQGGLSYNIVIGTQPGKYDIVSPSADRTTGFRRISSRGKIQSNSWFIRGLQPGTYYWSVQTIDGSFKGSAFATEKSFTVPQQPSGNYSLYFDGIDDFVGNMIENKIVGTTPFTVEMWAKIENPPPFNNIGLINKGINYGSAWSYNLLLHNTLSFGINSSIGAAYVDGGLPTSGVWHHIAGSRSSDGTLRLFLDGQKIGEHLVLTHDLQSPNDLRIGRNIESGVGSYFKGYITRIRLSKIDRYINNFVPVQQYTLDSNTVALWNFSTGSDTLLIDESDNQIHGTIQGATWSTEFPQVLSTVNLTSPNGGENWQVGASHDITWTYTNVSIIKIEYTTDYGSSWLQISPSTPALTGSYSWTIPNTASTNCRVKITDVSNSSINDQSNSTFIISTVPPQSVTVTSPNGGENWTAGTSQNITWTQTNISNLKIDYTTDNGANWNQIVSSVSANSGSYSWTVPNTPSTTCKVRITDVSNNQLSDQSNGTFTILPQSTGNYSLYFDGVNDYVGNIFENKVLGASPFTLELWVKNQSSNVAPLISRGSNSGVDWSYNLYVHDSLYFGVNAPLKYVGADSPSLNSWHHVAAVKSSDGFLKLYIDGSKVSESYYGTGNLTSNFSLQFGKYFADGSSDYFKGYLTRIRISKTARYIEDFNPTLTFVLDTNTAGLWNFSENSGTLLTDVSGNSFHGTIHGATWSSDFPQISGNINVTSPNGGENWTVGSAHYISWVQNGVSNVKIEYTTNQGITWQQIIASTSASTGNYLWTIPNTISTTCKVRITDVANGLVKDQSNAVFSISPAPNLTLTAPNGGENWQVGSSQNITWTQSGITNLKIEYSTNDGSSWTQIVASTPASAGSYQWTIPNTVSSSCRVRISDALNSSMSDQSNAVFTISAAPVFSVQVTSPNGGERWFAETQYSIAWNSVNVENLKLEYTSDGGAFWTQIAGSVAANLGSYIWTIPNTPSLNCKVRLTSVANPGITDESDAAFTIAETPKVTLTSPNGGETWMVGREYSITWTAASVNKLRGEYSTDGGTQWILIADTISANLGSYIWTMPNTESGNCLVRLSGIDQTSAGDQSDAPFTIELERSLALTAPVPGETYTSGRILEIKWSQLNVDLVDLLYSTDDGSYWQYIADSISSASQSYNWLIPELNSNQVRIRAVASQKQDLRSDLNGNITILPSPKISLVSNLSAAYLKTGSNYHIEWLLENVPAVNVLFSSDGGSVWNQIAGNLMPSVRSFNWVVPDLNSKNCRVKIEATNNSSLFSSNELTFTIYSYSQVVTVSNVWQFGDIRDVGNYRLISLPGSVTGDLGSIMSGKFTTDWNAYWDNGSDVDYQIQYNGGPQFNLQPGKGFWVLSKDPISLSKQTEAVTIDSTLLYHVPLHKGWNIIGNVFTKSINWSDIRFVNGLPQSSLLYYWDGKWDFPSVMEPYKGYYFFNPDNRSSLKIIYPVEASLAKTGEENPVSGKENGIVLSFGGNEILATFDPVSSTGLDTNDYFLPGVNFCRKRIAFTREDNGITRQLFIDSQPLDSLGNKFRFSILNETSTPDDLKLNLKIEQKNLNIYLLDEKYSEFIDLRVKNSFKLSPQKGSRYYTLMIGDDSFIRTMKSQYLPTEYLLYQNFPNPFNPETSIKYALPADGYIKLKMYDILGNEVLTLFEGEESAGVHTRAFNLSGFASGVYFYRLETSGTNLLKKMILMK